MKKTAVFKGACVAALALLAVSCGPREQAGSSTPALPSGDLLSRSRGKVVVALLGMAGCPGTEKATPMLADLAKTLPPDAVVCRIDVPPAGQTIKEAENLGPNLLYAFDGKREIAARLDFFFYPTVYVLDREGVVRFSGGCEPEKLRAMVTELVAEPAGAEKKMFTPPLAAAGSVIPDFQIAGADGATTSLRTLCGEAGALLYFSDTSCPFSLGGVKDLEKLKKDLAGSKLNFVIVSFGQAASDFGTTYASQSPGSAVVVDADKSLGTKYFGVYAVPFVYLLDRDGKVLDRRPFAYDAVRTAAAKALGLKLETPAEAAPAPGGG